MSENEKKLWKKIIHIKVKKEKIVKTNIKKKCLQTKKYKDIFENEFFFYYLPL